MKKIFFFITLLILAVLSSCGDHSRSTTPDRSVFVHDSLLKKVDSLEKRIAATMKTSALHRQLAANAANAYIAFARKFPRDTKAANFLFKASDISAGALHQYEQAVSLLDQITRNYPSFKKLPMCYFQLGAIYDDDLNDDAKAKGYYDTFLEKFPDHPL